MTGMEKCKAILRNQQGQGLSEYGLIIGLIAIVCIGALVVLGPTIAKKFHMVNQEIENAKPQTSL
ncbi:Flp family type IVb pilin [Syntrophomonas palmitatica]|uniref:Flp family type IVb pilin n=1 Tax=Syntrophomonas palmitatica TaxID=402877 RepID=UPI0006D0C2B0|nr:hypothetical protein [Syntrophomonas palmitatica]